MQARIKGGLTPALVGIAGLALLALLLTCFWPALRTLRHGFPTYYVSARLILEGRWTAQVYDDAWFSRQVMARTQNQLGEVFAPNPPSAALLMLPLAWLDLGPARVAWLWLSLAQVAAAIALLTLSLIPRQAAAWRAAFVAFACLYWPLRENLRLGQVYGLLLLLFALALWALRATPGRAPARAGVMLGVAAAAKLSGGPLWLVLALRGPGRRALAAGGLAAGLVVAVALALTGWPSWQRWFQVAAQSAAGSSLATATAFQTVPSFFQHLSVQDAQWSPAPPWPWPWLARVATWTVSAFALLWTLARGRAADLDLAFAAGLTLGVVLLPFAEEYHYTLLLLPLAVAAGRLAAERRPRSVAGVTVLAVAAVLLAAPWSYKSPELFAGWRALLAYPRLYGGFLLWAWLVGRMAPTRRLAQARWTT